MMNWFRLCVLGLFVPVLAGAIVGCQPAPVATRRQVAKMQQQALQAQADAMRTAGESQRDAEVDLSHEDLDGTAWMRTSAEYVSIARQTYLLAAERLALAVADKSWSAWPEQAAQLREPSADGAAGGQLLPAVILDIDETVLDNSEYQVELIERDDEYTTDSWHAWVEKKQARAVQGVREFLDECQRLGVTVFYITNRESDDEQSTRDNLSALGLLPLCDDDNVLTKRERTEWVEAGSNKEPRRAAAAEKHRILLILGDDLNDFVDAGQRPTAEARRILAEKYSDYWGTKWFVFPNPSYGGWERALYDFNDRLPRDGKLRGKREALRKSETP